MATVEVPGNDSTLPLKLQAIPAGERYWRKCKDGSGFYQVEAHTDGVVVSSAGSVIFVPLDALRQCIE